MTNIELMEKALPTAPLKIAAPGKLQGSGRKSGSVHRIVPQKFSA